MHAIYHTEHSAKGCIKEICFTLSQGFPNLFDKGIFFPTSKGSFPYVILKSPRVTVKTENSQALL